MPASATDLEAQALRLTPEERVRLADRLLASVSSDIGIEEAWSVEAERRLQEMESGVIVGVPIEGAIARARSAIG